MYDLYFGQNDLEIYGNIIIDYFTSHIKNTLN